MVSLGVRTGQDKGSCGSDCGRFRGDASPFLKAERSSTFISR